VCFCWFLEQRWGHVANLPAFVQPSSLRQNAQTVVSNVHRSGNRKGCDKMHRPSFQTPIVRATARVAPTGAGP
jgi:hypothetical protein